MPHRLQAPRCTRRPDCYSVPRALPWTQHPTHNVPISSHFIPADSHATTPRHHNANANLSTSHHGTPYLNASSPTQHTSATQDRTQATTPTTPDAWGNEVATVRIPSHSPGVLGQRQGIRTSQRRGSGRTIGGFLSVKEVPWRAISPCWPTSSRWPFMIRSWSDELDD